MRLIKLDWFWEGTEQDGKGENADYQHFHFFPQCFKNCISYRRKPGIVGRRYSFLGSLTLSVLMMTHEAFVDCVNQDQTAQNVQSDL